MCYAFLRHTRQSWANLSQFTRSNALAARRGIRTITTDDLIFLIRHDKAKVSRLKTFLAWKDVRKKAKESEEKGPVDTADFAAGEDVLANVAAAPMGAANGSNLAEAAVKKSRKQKVGLPWDLSNLYPIQTPEGVGMGTNPAGSSGPFSAVEEEDDDEEEEQNFATRQRLRAADKRTQNMTREEYVFFSECRQASFTYRKGKRFREWAGFQYLTDSRPNEDVVDMFGFLTLDIVQRLTEEALRVKEQEERSKRNLSEEEEEKKKEDMGKEKQKEKEMENEKQTEKGKGEGKEGGDEKEGEKEEEEEEGEEEEEDEDENQDKNKVNQGSNGKTEGKEKEREEGIEEQNEKKGGIEKEEEKDDDADGKDDGTTDAESSNPKKRKRERGLFDPPEEGRTPVEPRHVHEAFRRLQTTPNQSIMMLLHEGRPPRVPLMFVSLLVVFALGGIRNEADCLCRYKIIAIIQLLHGFYVSILFFSLTVLFRRLSTVPFYACFRPWEWEETKRKARFVAAFARLTDAVVFALHEIARLQSGRWFSLQAMLLDIQLSRSASSNTIVEYDNIRQSVVATERCACPSKSSRCAK